MSVRGDDISLLHVLREVDCSVDAQSEHSLQHAFSPGRTQRQRHKQKEPSAWPRRRLELRSIPVATTCGFLGDACIVDPAAAEEPLLGSSTTVILDQHGDLLGACRIVSRACELSTACKAISLMLFSSLLKACASSVNISPTAVLCRSAENWPSGTVSPRAEAARTQLPW